MENSNNIKKRGGTGKIFTEPYNPNRIERLKNIIKDFRAQGKPKRYCILVDGEMVVTVNRDPSVFDNYKRYLESDTQNIEVRMYFGDSPNCNRHIFQTNKNTLSGTEKGVKEQIEEALEKQRITTELENLKSKLKRKNRMIDEYEEIVDDLENKLEEKKLDVKELLQKGFELYGQYAANKNGVNAKPVQGIPQTKVEVEVNSEPESKADKFYNQMKEKYSKERLYNSLTMWTVWLNHPELKDEFMKIVTQKIKKDGEA